MEGCACGYGKMDCDVLNRKLRFRRIVDTEDRVRAINVTYADGTMIATNLDCVECGQPF